MWEHLRVFDSPKFTREPILLVSLSTANPQYQLLYSQARELSKYLLRKLGFKLLASLYCSAMPPEVEIAGTGVADLVSCNFYHLRGKRDVILFAGHSSPTTEEYDFCRAVLDYSKKLGVKELVSVGARWVESPTSPTQFPKVLGFSTDAEGVQWLRQNGVTLLEDETAFYFANLIVALAPWYGIRGFKVSVNHGEPRPHPKSLMAILKVLEKKLELEVDVADLVEESKKLEEALRRAGYDPNTPLGTSEEGGVPLGEEGEQLTQAQEEAQREDIYR
jgi:proteasome assembly chaperone (PAC2) family protein